jgi:hypothetical protein
VFASIEYVNRPRQRLQDLIDLARCPFTRKAGSLIGSEEPMQLLGTSPKAPKILNPRLIGFQYCPSLQAEMPSPQQIYDHVLIVVGALTIPPDLVPRYTSLISVIIAPQTLKNPQIAIRKSMTTGTLELFDGSNRLSPRFLLHRHTPLLGASCGWPARQPEQVPAFGLQILAVPMSVYCADARNGTTSA